MERPDKISIFRYKKYGVKTSHRIFFVGMKSSFAETGLFGVEPHQ